MNFCDHPGVVVGQMTILLVFKQNLVDPEEILQVVIPGKTTHTVKVWFLIGVVSKRLWNSPYCPLEECVICCKNTKHILVY